MNNFHLISSDLLFEFLSLQLQQYLKAEIVRVKLTPQRIMIHVSNCIVYLYMNVTQLINRRFQIYFD